MASGDSLPPLPSAPLPGRYRHFKGNLYEVVGLARHSEDLAPLVVYRPIHDDGTPKADGWWVRPHSMWAEKVTHEGQAVARFSPV